MTAIGASVRTMFLFSLLMGLMATVGFLLAGSVQGILLFAGFTALFSLGSLFWGDKLVLKSYRAKQVSQEEAPRLHAMVERVASTAGIPKPEVYVIPTDMPNAFATGRSPKHGKVAFTQGLMRGLTEEELEGVAAHEIAHIRHRDTLIMVVAAMVAGTIGAMVRWIFWGSLFGGNRENGAQLAMALAVGIVASIIAMVIQMAISRAREFKADAGAAEYTGRPMALASALRKLENWNDRGKADVNPGHATMFIVNPLRGGFVGKLFSTHPSMDDRVERLERMAGLR